MCGIYGTYTQNPNNDLDQRLKNACTALYNRGPNDHGQEIFSVASGILALGHTRLSIIDLTPGGHQPMHSADKRFTIVFNGEIYNYKELREDLKSLGYNFYSDSDTEVLLNCWTLWGKECLPKLVGMFSFVVYDNLEKTLTLVRDAFGIKPLFYRQNNDGFCFASELPALKSLLTEKLLLNLQCAYDFLVWGRYDNQESTFYNAVKHLMPGYLMVVGLGNNLQYKTERWWWPNINESSDYNFEQAVEKLREIFLENVRLHLRSDVPLGIALSGGLDSSSLVCALRYIEPDLPIHTFSYVARGSEVDEERWVDIINDHVGAISHKVIVSPQELVKDLDDLIQVQGEPFRSTSIYAQYRVYKLARENGITVTLDGQGADELLAGYNGYPSAYLRSLMERGHYIEMINFLNRWSKWPGRRCEQAIRLLITDLLPKNINCQLKSIMVKLTHPEWLNMQNLLDHNINMYHAFDDFTDTSDSIGRRLVSTLRSALTVAGLQSLLRHGDRNSMHWSIESRVPFLTVNLAEFLLTLPESFLLSPEGETKRVFRAAMRGIVPEMVLKRRDKVGFATPEREWLMYLRDQIDLWLAGAETISFLDASACRSEFYAILNGTRPFSFQAWRMINFCRWAQTNFVGN